MSRAMRRVAGALIAAAALAVFVPGVEAQQATVPPVARTAPRMPPPAREPPTQGSAEKAAATACAGLDEKACRATAACSWIAATKVKPYCRRKPAATGAGAGQAAAPPVEK